MATEAPLSTLAVFHTAPRPEAGRGGERVGGEDGGKKGTVAL